MNPNFKLIGLCLILLVKASYSQTPVTGSTVNIQSSGDNTVNSIYNEKYYQLIGTYPGWDQNAVFIAGYNAFSSPGANSTKRAIIGGPYTGTPYLVMDFETGNLGLNTIYPNSYFHGGNNRVFEIFNPNTSIHSQSQLILSTGSTLSGSSAGGITWISRNSAGYKGMAYINSYSVGDESTNATGKIVFATSNAGVLGERMTIDQVGNVGIGTIDPQAKLGVKGLIRAKEIKVEESNWPDYVFDSNYKLPSLTTVEAFIDKNKHLSDMPSAADVAKDGVNLGEMNKQLLKKIEELTLYLIEERKANRKQNYEIAQLKKIYANKNLSYRNRQRMLGKSNVRSQNN